MFMIHTSYYELNAATPEVVLAYQLGPRLPSGSNLVLCLAPCSLCCSCCADAPYGAPDGADVTKPKKPVPLPAASSCHKIAASDAYPETAQEPTGHKREPGQQATDPFNAVCKKVLPK